MRLTLRTLLAYLDDTLEPAEAKAIGEKVAESDIAPELIERIKRVTRRRGLAAPPLSSESEDAASDPNTVAEYLDNELSSDQLSEIEQSALSSDAYLAEISACHQILTLVLSEPAKVPPTARQRMYRVVKGRESIPYRRAPLTNNVAGFVEPVVAEENTEAEEALLLGMTHSRLLIPTLSALVIGVLLIGVIWLAIPATKPNGAQGYIAIADSSPGGKGSQDTSDVAKANGKNTVDSDPTKNNAPTGPEVLDVPPRVAEATPAKPPEPAVLPPDNPDPERKPVARLETRDMILVQQTRDISTWERVTPGKEVYSADTLMSLPGNRCELKLDSGVRLLLWGSLPEMQVSPMPVKILESRVTLHAPPRGLSADFTLQSGRVFILPPAKFDEAKPPRVRVRFREEIWDLTLREPDTEICFDLLSFYAPGTPFSKDPGGPAPKTDVYLGLLKGKADLRVKFKEFKGLTAPTRIDWESTTGEISNPEKIKPAEMLWWSKTLADHQIARELQKAIASFVDRLSKPEPDKTNIEVIFFSAMADPTEPPGRRVYSIYCLEALDAINYLTDAIGDDFSLVRAIGIQALRFWCGLSPERDLKVYKLLMEKKSYTEAQALAVMQLMHPLSERDQKRPEIILTLFDALGHEKIAVRELAWEHLALCDPKGVEEIRFLDVAGEKSTIDAIARKWKASWQKRFLDQNQK